MAVRAAVGVDVGTQTTKAQVVALDGTPLATAAVETALTRPAPSAVEQHASELEDSVLHAIAGAVRDAGDGVEVVALAVAGQMGGAVGVDERFEPVTPYESWLDTRADDDRVRILDTVGTDVVAAGGIIPFVGPRVARWRREEPARYARIAKVLAPTGYVTGRLTGATDAGAATCDRTQAHLFGCFDVASGRWRPDLAAGMEVECSSLPRVVDPLDVIDGLGEDAARRCGLPAGTPVAGGLGDGTAGWVAAGAFEPGTCVDTGGSSEHFATTLDTFVTDPYPGTLLTCMPSAMSGRYHLFGFTGGTGLTRRWWTDLTGNTDYEALERLAATAPPRADGVLAVPHLSGMLTPFDPYVRGTFAGCDASTTAADMYRALCEAMAFEFRDWLRHVADLVPDGPAPRAATAIGGAARSTVSARVKADVLGIPYVRMRPHVNAARGAALVAAAAVGEVALDDPRLVDEERDVLDRCAPDPGVAETYRRRERRYRELLAVIRPLYRSWGGESR